MAWNKAANIPIAPATILAFAAFVAPLLAIYAALGMAPLLAFGAAALVLDFIVAKRAFRFHRRYAIILGCVLAWGLISLLWTLNPKGALLTAAQLCGVFLCTLILVGSPSAYSRATGHALLAGFTVALSIYSIENVFNAPIQSLIGKAYTEPESLYSPFNRGLAVLVMLLPAVVMTLRRSRPFFCVIVIGWTAAVVFAYFGSAMKLALVVELAVFAVVLATPRIAVRIIGSLAAAMILAAPFAANLFITPELVEAVSRRSENISVQHRLVIWRFAAQNIMERPLTGWGLDSARVLREGKTPIRLHAKACQAPCYRVGELLPLHPHNMALQWWLELGVIGAAFGAALILSLFWTIAGSHFPIWDRALLAAQAAAGIVISGLSYGAWQSWWLSTLALVSAFSLCVLNQRNGENAEYEPEYPLVKKVMN